MEGEILPCGWLLTGENKVAALGPMDTLPQHAGETFDANGGTVLPGLIDAHCHLGMWEDAIDFEGDDGNETTDPVTPQLRAIDAINPMDRCFREAAAAGVTTVVTGPGSANPIGGQFVAMKTLGERMDDMILKAPLCMKFALGENPKRVYGQEKHSPATRMATAAHIREALFSAREYGEKKARALEKGEDLPDFDMKLEALLPVVRGELTCHFHAHRADDIFTAVRIAREFSLDYVVVHGTEGWMVADTLQREGVRVITGPFLTDRSKPELKNLSIAGTGRLSSAGMQPAICTDHPVIPSNHLLLCAALAHREGMDELEALKAVTLYPARILGLSDRVGSLTPGRDADLVVFPGHPFDLSAGPALVLLEGRPVPREGV